MRPLFGLLKLLYSGELFHYVGRVRLTYNGCQIYFVAFILFSMEKPVRKNADPDQTPHYVASDLGLHCLPLTFLWVSR